MARTTKPLPTTTSQTASSGVPGSGIWYVPQHSSLPSLRLTCHLSPQQNDGSQKDAARRAAREAAAWPYSWFTNPSVGPAYHSRVRTVRGRITLSDGRPASGAAVFLGDNHPTKTALDQGTTYYYTTYADKFGYFQFDAPFLALPQFDRVIVAHVDLNYAREGRERRVVRACRSSARRGARTSSRPGRRGRCGRRGRP